MAAPVIQRMEDRNYTGICHLDVVESTGVLNMAPEVNGNVAGITLKAGVSWSRVYLEDSGGSFTEKWVHQNGLQHSMAQVNGMVAKLRLELMPGLWKMKGRRYIVLVTLRNDDKLIIGRPETPAMAYVEQLTSGDNPGQDRNDMSIAFSLSRRWAVPFFGGTPPVYSDPGECAPAAVLINGVEVAIVNSGDEEDIAVTDPDGVPVGEWNEEEDRWEVEATGSCDSAVASLRDTEGTLLGTIMIPSGGTDDVIAPDGTVRTTDAAATVGTVLSGGTLDLPQSVIKYKDTANADQETFAMDTDFASGTLRPHGQVPRRELTLNGAGTGQYVTLADLLAGSVPNITTPRAITASWAAGNDETIPVVMPAEYQGASYAYVSDTGTNGTITVSVDGGATYAAPPFTVGTLGVSFKRTTYAAAGSVLYEA